MFWAAYATILRGRGLVELEPGKEAVAQIHQGLAGYRATGAELECPYFVALLAEALGKIGHIEEGLTVLAEMLGEVDSTGLRFHDAELRRLTGECLLWRAIRDETRAETCFRQALDVAHLQQAKSLELRAAMSLSRLWQRQDKRAEARQLLGDIYGCSQRVLTPEICKRPGPCSRRCPDLHTPYLEGQDPAPVREFA